MLTGVGVFGVQPGSEISMTLGSLTDLIQIRNIEGLGPVKASISSSPYGSSSGEAFTGASQGKRNIVLTLGLNPDWNTQTYEELRKLLYKYFIPTFPVTLAFENTHLPACQIDGIVEDMEPNQGSKDPECVISILCLLPDFIAVDETVITGTVDYAVDQAAVIAALATVEYEGSIPTGGVIKVESSAGKPTYSGHSIIVDILNGNVDWATYGKTFQVTGYAGDIDATHRLEIGSVSGAKYVKRITTNTGVAVNLLPFLVDGYTWPVLKPGTNKFNVRVPAPGSNAGQNWTLSYFARFGGL